jgi:hypothetical protein
MRRIAFVSWLCFLARLTAQTPEEAVQLPPIVVSPSAYTLLEKVGSPAELNIKDAANLPLIDNDVLRTMHLFPGVIASDFSARFQLRGSEKGEVLVRLDGVELPDPFHLQDFGGAMSAIDLSLIRNARLYMGGFAPSLGDRMGGVFDLETVEPDRNGETLLGLDLINLQLQNEGRLGDGGYLLSARRGYVDLIMALVDAIEPLNEKFRPRFFDLYGKVDYPLGEDGRLTPSFLYSRDTNVIDKLGRIDDLESTYDNFIAWTRFRARLNAITRLDVTPYGGTLQRDKRDGESDFDVRDIAFAGVRADAWVTPAPEHALSFGGDARWAEGTYDYHETTSPFPELDDSQPPIDVHATLTGVHLSAYAQDEWTVTPRIGVVLGGRVLSQTHQMKPVLSPRVAVAYRMASAWTARAAWGVFRQAIDAMNLPVEAGVASERKPETAVHSVIGAEWTPSERLSVRVEGYRKTYRHLAGRVRDVGRKSQFVVFPLPEEGRAYGGEVFVQGRPSPRFAWTGGYAYAVAEVLVNGRHVPRDFDQRYTVLVNGTYALSDATTVNVGWRFHTGTPVTPVAFATDGESGQLVPVLGETNSVRVPPFHSLDARISKRYDFRRWNLTAYLQVINLTFRNNVQEYSYDPAQGYARVEESYLPFTPTFGLVAAF